jgi:drug/metabolite transporter (DMT)-like permease
MLWFMALPKIPMADTTAIGFMSPIFIMLGAYLFFREAMRWDRWLAALIGFTGVLIVVAPGLSGSGGYYSLIMLASSPVFAASFLMTKALTRYERTEVIVLWQAIAVTVLSLPLAVWFWSAPSAWQWVAFLVTGIMGVTAHYCITRGFAVADISSTQSVKFLDLVWASAMGWLVFSESPSTSTLMGGAVICGSTIWIAHRESRARGGLSTQSAGLAPRQRVCQVRRPPCTGVRSPAARASRSAGHHWRFRAPRDREPGSAGAYRPAP